LTRIGTEKPETWISAQIRVTHGKQFRTMHFSSSGLHLKLDDAWQDEPLGLPVADVRNWGPQLRFSAPPRLVAEFYRDHETHLASPFLLYGSGDFII